jgi:hypothetical protein
MSVEIVLQRALNKLAKWRGVFAGWQLGTRADTDSECQAVRDHREVTILLRAEVNALTKCLIDSKLVDAERFQNVLLEEAQWLDKAYERKFPGISTSEVGVHYRMPEARETMKGWRP